MTDGERLAEDGLIEVRVRRELEDGLRGLAEESGVGCLVVVRVEEGEQPDVDVVEAGEAPQEVQAALAQRRQKCSIPQRSL